MSGTSALCRTDFDCRWDDICSERIDTGVKECLSLQGLRQNGDYFSLAFKSKDQTCRYSNGHRKDFCDPRSGTLSCSHITRKCERICRVDSDCGDPNVYQCLRVTNLSFCELRKATIPHEDSGDADHSSHHSDPDRPVGHRYNPNEPSRPNKSGDNFLQISLIMGGVILLLLILYLVIFKFYKKDGEDEMQKPAANDPLPPYAMAIPADTADSSFVIQSYYNNNTGMQFLQGNKKKQVRNDNTVIDHQNARPTAPPENPPTTNLDKRLFPLKAPIKSSIDTKYIYQNKSNYQIIKSLVIFKLCSFKPLIDFTPRMLKTAEKLRIEKPLYSIIEKTIFNHFCGGVSAKDVVPTMKTLEGSGLGSILDLSIEADITPLNENQTRKQYYENHIKSADQVEKWMMECIDTASQVKGNFVALKITPLASPELLLILNKFYDWRRTAFKSDMKLSEVLALFQESFHDKIKMQLQDTKDDTISWNTFREIISVKNHSGLKTPVLESYDLEYYAKTLERLYSLCDFAESKNVQLMVDAEQTYFQRGIDEFALELMKKYNSRGRKPLIYNTYQMYLKDSFSRLERDMETMKSNNASFAVKLVRGAYMVSERERADELSLPDPIHSDIDATHSNYNKALKLLLSKMNENDIYLTVASHNADSIDFTVKTINESNVDIKHRVVFGQLLGMSDFLTYTLAKHGYSAYKYVPYGPVKEVVPYLIRRAQENSAILENSSSDQYYLEEELRRRSKKEKDN